MAVLYIPRVSHAAPNLPSPGPHGVPERPRAGRPGPLLVPAGWCAGFEGCTACRDARRVEESMGREQRLRLEEGMQIHCKPDAD